MDENLRFGPDYRMPAVATTLAFVEDVGGFARTTERCIGMGKCRAATGAMCPSYQASGEERHSTRGRAHLLHELVRGEVIADGWANADVADSLEHCLSCKACKSECPTQVDIASWKAEFMARHWAGRRRPLHHRAFGHMGTTLPRLARAPALVNALQASPLGRWSKSLLGIAPDKTLPELAREPFARWAQRHADGVDTHFFLFEPGGRALGTSADKPDGAEDAGGTNGTSRVGADGAGDSAAGTFAGDPVGTGGAAARDDAERGAVGHDPSVTPVVLWADSVNAHYRPEILASAVRALLAAGIPVAVARNRFCCGRPLYEYGFLGRARTQLADILDGFHAALPPDAQVIVLEPSCLSVFRDELLRLFPDEERASDLASRAMTLSSCLTERGVRPARTLGRGVLHLHCHDKSLALPSDERAWMRRCFDEIVEPESGCCGMAGTYGMRMRTRPIAQRLFARRLAPAIAAEETGTHVVANGFSCREQIRDGSDRAALHPVEVIERCL